MIVRYISLLRILLKTCLERTIDFIKKIFIFFSHRLLHTQNAGYQGVLYLMIFNGVLCHFENLNESKECIHFSLPVLGSVQSRIGVFTGQKYVVTLYFLQEITWLQFLNVMTYVHFSFSFFETSKKNIWWILMHFTKLDTHADVE